MTAQKKKYSKGFTSQTTPNDLARDRLVALVFVICVVLILVFT